MAQGFVSSAIVLLLSRGVLSSDSSEIGRNILTMFSKFTAVASKIVGMLECVFKSLPDLSSEEGIDKASENLQDITGQAGKLIAQARDEYPDKKLPERLIDLAKVIDERALEVRKGISEAKEKLNNSLQHPNSVNTTGLSGID